jgi:hypothetical protein
MASTEVTQLIQNQIQLSGEAAEEKLYGQANYHMLTAIVLTLGCIHSEISTLNDD